MNEESALEVVDSALSPILKILMAPLDNIRVAQETWKHVIVAKCRRKRPAHDPLRGKDELV